MTISIVGILGGATALGVAGMDSASSSVSCKGDLQRLKTAETTYYQREGAYANEDELVKAELLSELSESHEVISAGSSYTIAESGRCIGTNTSYGSPAPVVGVSDQSGATVALFASDGNAVAGGVVEYGVKSKWTTMGTTDSSGKVNSALSDGIYDFRVAYKGATNTLSAVNVKQGTMVTFPAVALTVTLANGAGAPLSGGTVTIRGTNGSNFAFGTTSLSGSVVGNVLPSAYDVTMTYSKKSVTRTAQPVNGAKTVSFATGTLTVKMMSGKTGLSGGAVSVTPSGGSPTSIGSTDSSGSVTTTLMDGNYTVTMVYQGWTSTQTIAFVGDATVTFSYQPVTVKLVSSSGVAMSGSDSAIWYRSSGSKSWTFAGYPSNTGEVSLSVLPGNYDFQARWMGVYEVQSAVAVTSATTVTFTTYAATESLVSSGGVTMTGSDLVFWLRPSGGTFNYYAYPNGSGIATQYVLAGTYDFQTRWMAKLEVRSSVSIGAPVAVTFTSYAMTETVVSSLGAVVTATDQAFWLRPSGGAFNYYAYPSAGVATQYVLAGTYDFQARFNGVLEVKSSVVVAAASPVTFATAKLTVTCTLGGTPTNAASVYAIVGTSSFYLGLTTNANIYDAQLLASTYSIRCVKASKQGTVNNVVLPMTGSSVAVAMV